jgi:glycogen synthase
VAETLRILILADQFWPSIGGIEVLTAALARALQARGHDVVVATGHGSFAAPETDNLHGVRIHRFRFQEALVTRRLDLFEENFRRLLRVRREFRPQVAYVCGAGAGVLFHLRAQARDPVPTLFGLHHGLTLEVASRDAVMCRILREADHVLAVSRAIQEDVLRIAPEVAGRCTVIYNGLEMPTLAPAPLPFDSPRLVCVGRLVKEKGLDCALRAFAELSPRLPRARLTMAGDGPLREALAQQAADLGIADRVDFTGWVAPERIPELMNSATVFLMPSRWREAFGLVTLEAMQMARPVVATRVGGTPELVVDGETGALVPRDDHAAMASATVALLEQPALAKRLGDAGRRRAATKFSFEASYQAFERLCSTLAAAPQHARSADATPPTD